MKYRGRLDRKYIYYVSTLNEHRYFWCSSERRWVALDDVGNNPWTQVRIHRRCRTMKAALRWSSKLLRLGVPGANVQIDRQGPNKAKRQRSTKDVESGQHYQTRGALGGSRKSSSAYHTHTVEVAGPEVGADEVRVLCDKIQLDNISDCHAPVEHGSAPTCPSCRARDPRFVDNRKVEAAAKRAARKQLQADIAAHNAGIISRKQALNDEEERMGQLLRAGRDVEEERWEKDVREGIAAEMGRGLNPEDTRRLVVANLSRDDGYYKRAQS